MTITKVNFDWNGYYCMLAFITLWNCGFMAITRPGKIFNFILAFFERTRRVKTMCEANGNLTYDRELQNILKGLSTAKLDVAKKAVSDYLVDHGIFCEQHLEDQIANLVHQVSSERQGNVTVINAYNTYYYYKDVRIFPDYLTDPIVTCITCMASFHSIILYTAVVLYMNLSWNPFEWMVLAIPAAFTGETLWALKKKIQA